MNSILKSKSSLRAAVLVGSIAALLFPAKGSAADAFFIGSAGDHNLTTPSNWVGGTAAGDWDRLVFGSDVVDGTLNLNNFNGRSGITLTSGLTQDITIVNNQPLIMASVGGDGFIDMSAATHNLTIYAQYHQGLQDVRFRKHRSKVKRKVRLCPDINSPLSSSVKTLLPSRPKMSSAVVLRLTAIVSSRGLCALCWRPD